MNEQELRERAEQVTAERDEAMRRVGILQGEVEHLRARTRPTKRNAGIYVEQSVLERAESITKADGVKSRNVLLGDLLTFSLDLYPLLKPLLPQIKAMESSSGCSQAEAIALLVERGLGDSAS